MKIESPVNSTKEVHITETDLIKFVRKRGLTNTLIKETIIDIYLEEYKTNESTENLLEEFKKTKKITDDFKYKEFLEKNSLDEKLLIEIITRPRRIREFREDRWGNSLEALYLKHKHEYDKIVYKQISCSSPDTMQEVYFRLKDGEETWSEVAKLFLGNQDKSEGLKGPIFCKNVDEKLISEMKKAGENKITKPILNSSGGYSICKLVKIIPTVLDNNLRDEILNLEFNIWLEKATQRIQNTVTY